MAVVEEQEVALARVAPPALLLVEKAGPLRRGEGDVLEHTREQRLRHHRTVGAGAETVNLDRCKPAGMPLKMVLRARIIGSGMRI